MAEQKKLNPRAMAKHKKRFLKFFPRAYKDQRYIDWERTYKWTAHELFQKLLNEREFKSLLRSRDYDVIASRALQVEGKTNFLFSFEKMALRDALKTPEGARIFSNGLYELLHGTGDKKEKFIQWIVSVSQLPRTKSRVLSWPITTFFPFIAQPDKHIIMKPTAMKVAAHELGYDLEYSSKPSYTTYHNLLELADLVGREIKDLKPQDYHDLQSFLWTIGSGEYEVLGEELGID